MTLSYKEDIFFLLVFLLATVSLLSVYFIYSVTIDLLNKNKEEVLLESMNEQMKNYQLFYEFCNVQQNNIRYFYHDLNNHLSTLKLLVNDDQEYYKYLNDLKNKYRNCVVKDTTNDILINILIEYYKTDGLIIDVLDDEMINDIDYIEILNILDELKKKCSSVGIDFRNKIIYADIDDLDVI